MFRILSFCSTQLIVIACLSQSAAGQTTVQELPQGWNHTSPPGIVGEPAALRKLMNSTDGLATSDRQARDGLYPELGGLVTGAGWFSLGPGYRRHVLGKQAVVAGSLAVSGKLYQAAQASFELPQLAGGRISLGSRWMYHDLRQVDFFGVGADSPESDESAYRLRSQNVVGYGTYRAASHIVVSGRLGWLLHPHLLDPKGPRLDVPSAFQIFDPVSVPGLSSSAPSFLHGDVGMTVDWSNHPGHPTRGGSFRAALTAYSDRERGTYSFRRYELEAFHVLPLFTTKWTLAAHVWEVFSDTSAGREVPFYLLPSLGGGNTLRGYTDYRFHDRNMQVLNMESRWALMAHVDVAAFYDTGKVAPRAAELDFTQLRHSYGLGLRLHNSTTTLARIDAGHSPEGWHLFFKFSDVLRRTTPAFGRTSVAPFVP